MQEEVVQKTQVSLTEAEAGLKKLRKVIHQVKEDRSYYRGQAEQLRCSLWGGRGNAHAASQNAPQSIGTVHTHMYVRTYVCMFMHTVRTYVRLLTCM